VALAAGLSLLACGGGAGEERGGAGHDGRRPRFAKGEGTPPSREETRVPVVATVATRGDMRAFLDASSTLEAEASVEVVSQATGVVAEILAEEGDRFRAGQSLARLEYREIELAERRARSERERLRANFARAEKLVGEQLIPVEDYQQVQFDLARAEIDWQQAALELERTRITAPISGTVTERMINVGDLVRENDPVYRVVDFDSLVAPVYVPEKHLASLRVGQQAIVDPPALGGGEVPARIKRISPVVDSQSGTVEVILDMDRPDNLRPGMFANVRLVLDRHEGVVVLLKKCLVYEDEEPHVFVIEQGEARKQPVELGYQDESRAEVLSGLEAGQWVVLVGQSTLKDGSPVAAEDEEGRPLDLPGAETGIAERAADSAPPTTAGSGRP
jgi:membrane fusion protein (multidrug efflux system)